MLPAPALAPPTPRSSSGRSSRCSAWARSRLAASRGSSAAARLQRSTPPAASSLDTAATSSEHVSQNVVGNGLPLSSNACCSVTAGCPNGHRTTTRLKARGGLPSWRSTTARSLSIAADRSGVAFPPGLNALDDEEVLAGAEETEPPRLARERVAAGREVKPILQDTLLARQAADLGAPRRELVARLGPASERVGGRVADRQHQHDGKPPPRKGGERWTARSPCGHERRIRGGVARSFQEGRRADL